MAAITSKVEWEWEGVVRGEGEDEEGEGNQEEPRSYLDFADTASPYFFPLKVCIYDVHPRSRQSRQRKEAEEVLLECDRESGGKKSEN